MKQDTREKIILKRGYRKNIFGTRDDLYISNYPVAAKYLAQRIGNQRKVLVELCCGVLGHYE